MPGFVCISVPYFIGERIESRTEIDKIRASGFSEEIGATWADIVPHWNDAPDRVTAVNRALAQALRTHADRIPLIFASDCMSSLGALKGLCDNLAARDAESCHMGVLWYDAHGDFNTPDTTPSGFLGGMPLAMLVGRGDMQYMDGVGLDPIAEQDVIITDARDLDPAEGEALHASAITHLADVDDLLTATLPDKPLYVHLDVDVVHLDDMPGMAYPAEGGPRLAQVTATVERVARDYPIAGVLFSLWNAALAPDARPLENTLHLARTLVHGIRAR